MTPTELKHLVDGLAFERDARKRPDKSRRDRFRSGWRRATSGRSGYSTRVLRRLTWQNLGFRIGAHCGSLPEKEIDHIHDLLANQWSAWTPRRSEDLLLHAYWQQVGGRIYVEVPIGGPSDTGDWPLGCTRRRLDGVRLQNAEALDAVLRFDSRAFFVEVRSAEIELIEVKPRLNRLVIGQIIAGRDMFERQYGVSPACCTIVCAKTDTALEWVSQKHGIQVRVVVAPDGLPNNALQRPARPAAERGRWADGRGLQRCSLAGRWTRWCE